MDKSSDHESTVALARQVGELGNVVNNLANRVVSFENIAEKLNARIDESAKQQSQNLTTFAKDMRSEFATISREASERSREIAVKLDERSRINWQPIGILVSIGGIALTATTGLLGYLISQQQSYTNKVEQATVQAVGDLGRRIDGLDGKFWSKADIQARLNEMQKDIDRTDSASAKKDQIEAAAKMRDAFQEGVKERMGRIEGTIEANRNNVVPRGEHEREWAAQRERDSGIQRQLDEVKRDSAGLYGPRDEIKRLQSRIDQLERAGKSAN